MSRVPEEREGVRIGRYLDGEMAPAERQAFETRLRDEPTLRAQAAELSGLSDWFVDGPVPRPSPGFRSRVLAVAARPVPVSADDRVIAWSRRVVYAAAALFVLGILVAVGALRPADSGRLEASPAEIDRAMTELDQRIEATARPEDGR